MQTTRTWSVGEVAQTSGVTVRTLHHWDELRVLPPSPRSVGGRRRYTEDDLARLYVVLTLRGFGMPLETIRRCLDDGLDVADPAELLTLMHRARGLDGALARELTEQQRERLAEGAAAARRALPYLLEVEWPQLYRRAQELRRTGAAPDDEAVQQVVARMDELAERSGGGDGTAVRAAWRKDPAAMSGEPEAVAGR